MVKTTLLSAFVAATLLSAALPAGAAESNMQKGNIQSLSASIPSGPDHGMPTGLAGGDGATYTGKPDLQAAISLITAGGAPGHFSIVRAITAMAGPTVAKAEVAKLTKQYGEERVESYVTVQNFAVNDAVAKVLAAKVALPKPHLTGATLAKRVVGLGLINGTYYEGYQLDHLITNPIHEAVMSDIDAKYGTVADANYHLISNQAHYDLAQALGVTSVQLAPYH